MERHFWQMRIGGGGGGSGSAHKIRHTIQTIGVSLCHRISCLTKIYLLSITSRNTEVDLNYRSLVLWQRFAIFTSLRIERRKKWKKMLSPRAHSRTQVVRKEMASDQEMPMKDCLLLREGSLATFLTLIHFLSWNRCYWYEKKCQFNFCRKNDVAVEFCGREWELRLKMIAAVIGGQCVLCGTCASMLFEAST